jgi:hypothetical protein
MPRGYNGYCTRGSNTFPLGSTTTKKSWCIGPSTLSENVGETLGFQCPELDAVKTPHKVSGNLCDSLFLASSFEHGYQTEGQGLPAYTKFQHAEIGFSDQY